MPEPANQPITSSQSRRRRIYVWLATVLIGLLAVGLLCWRWSSPAVRSPFDAGLPNLNGAMGDFVAGNWPTITPAQKAAVAKQVQASGFTILKVASVTGLGDIRLDDGRKLGLPFLKEASDPKQRSECLSLLRRLLVESNFVVYATPYSGVKESKDGIEVRVIYIHTGKMSIANLATLLLEKGLARIDEASDYANDPEYSAYAKYYGVGTKAGNRSRGKEAAE